MHQSTEIAGTKGFLTRRRWNPYLVGIGIGLLSWAVFAIVNKPLGVTTALSEWSGAVACPVIGVEGLTANAYWAKHFPQWDYGTLFLIGTFFGALAGAWLSRDLRVEVVPTVWRQRFGSSPALRLGVAFAGGLLTMYGARMAGGCTSGNGLSGSMQLAVSGWTFFLTMFATGLATAWLMFSGHRKPSTTSGEALDLSSQAPAGHTLAAPHLQGDGRRGSSPLPHLSDSGKERA